MIAIPCLTALLCALFRDKFAFSRVGIVIKKTLLPILDDYTPARTHTCFAPRITGTVARKNRVPRIPYTKVETRRGSREEAFCPRKRAESSRLRALTAINKA